jgi:hypothetical protein
MHYCITECGESDDEGKQNAVLHGFFQGDYDISTTIEE